MAVEPEVVHRMGANLIRLNVPATADGPRVAAILDVLVSQEGGGAPLRVLVDLRALRSFDASARSVVYRRRAENRDRCFAVVGRRGFQAFLYRFLTLATRQKRSRFFLDESEALEWLRGEPRSLVPLELAEVPI